MADRTLAALTVAALAWGVLAFGAVYPWAYWPLLLVLTAIGAAGLAASPHDPSRPRLNRPLAAGLFVLAGATALQLVPLPRDLLRAISPSADPLLTRYELSYSLALAGDPASHAISIQPNLTRTALLVLAGLSVFLLGAMRIIQGRHLRLLCSGIVLVGVAVAMIGIVQRPFYNGRIYGFWTPEAGAIRFGPAGGPFGPFVNRNHFAGWMLMALPLVLGHLGGMVAVAMTSAGASWHARIVWCSSAEAGRMIFTAFAAALMTLALLMTLSRSGMVCFAIALAMSGVAILRRGPRRARTALFLLYLASIAAAALAWTGTGVVAARFGELQPDAGGRLLAWMDAWRVAMAFPLAGTGLNTYGTAMLFYQTFQSGAVHFAQAHNDYLQLAAEGGVLVGVPAAALIAVFVREVRRRFKEGADRTERYWIRCGAATGLIAIALQEIVDFSLQMPANAALFALLCAIAAHVPPASGTRMNAERH